MKVKELNRKLADLLGYSVYHYDKDYEANCYCMLVDPSGEYSDLQRKTEEEAWEDIPDYCNDFAASLEAQAAAIAASPNEYVRNLEVVKWGQSTGWKFSNLVVAQLLTATPRQRAEAAYQTLLNRPEAAAPTESAQGASPVADLGGSCP